jgi:hypothetical protein
MSLLGRKPAAKSKGKEKGNLFVYICELGIYTYVPLAGPSKSAGYRFVPFQKIGDGTFLQPVHVPLFQVCSFL